MYAAGGTHSYCTGTRTHGTAQCILFCRHRRCFTRDSSFQWIISLNSSEQFNAEPSGQLVYTYAFSINECKAKPRICKRKKKQVLHRKFLHVTSRTIWKNYRAYAASNTYENFDVTKSILRSRLPATHIPIHLRWSSAYPQIWFNLNTFHIINMIKICQRTTSATCVCHPHHKHGRVVVVLHGQQQPRSTTATVTQLTHSPLVSISRRFRNEPLSRRMLRRFGTNLCFVFRQIKLNFFRLERLVDGIDDDMRMRTCIVCHLHWTEDREHMYAAASINMIPIFFQQSTSRERCARVRDPAHTQQLFFLF